MRKYIDWNQASELGLIVRINKEILHPLGLAMSRDIDTGVSEAIYIAEDGIWEYSQETLDNNPIKTKEEIQEYINNVE